MYQETTKINEWSERLKRNYGNNLKASCFRPFMREKVQLVIEPYASLTDGKNPLSAPHESFCRYAFTIIKEGKPASMNMRWITDTQDQASSFLEFKELFEYAKDLHIQSRFKKTSSNNSPAFNLVFKSGNYTKGKTAVQVLKENSNGIDILKSQRSFLEKNVATYKGNQQYIDAIDEALSLSSDQIAAADSSVSITLFDSGLRSKLSTVLKGQKIKPNTKHEKVPCYNGTITFFPGMDYPLEVKISNFLASVNVDDKGLTVIDTKTAIEKVDGSISLTFNEALRLYEELNRYHDIKANELYYYGITASENIGASERRSQPQTKPSTATVEEPQSEIPAEATSDNNSANVNAEKEIKVLRFESCSSISKTDNDFILRAKFVNSKGHLTETEYNIVFNANSDVSKDDFISFRNMVSTETVDFEIECYQEDDGNIHVVKFVA